PVYTVSGTITGDAQCISGVTIASSVLGNTTTNGAGFYQYVNVAQGTTYTVTPSKTGCTFTPTNAGANNITGNQVHNFTGTVNKYTVSGTITGDAQCISGVTMTSAALGNTTTNGAGQYSYTNIPYGTSYTITPSKTGCTFTPSSASGTATQNNVHNFVASLVNNTYTVSGTITGDPECIAGVSMQSAALGTIPTDGAGHYNYPSVAPGTTYTITPIKSGCLFQPTSVSDVANTNKIHNFVGSLTVPDAPINVQASDGTFRDYVFVTWDAAQNATSYQVYRSQFPGGVGSPIGDPVTVTTYLDRSAVPGVTYYYSVVAMNRAGQSVNSNIDPGYRLGDGECADQGGDADGDGICCDQEIIDGTDCNDPGSFQLHLKSPAYTKYNTFLKQFNFLELIANGTVPVTARVEVFDINGNKINETQVNIPVDNQVDVDIHTMAGRIDTYGIVKVSWNDRIPGSTLVGRMSNYRKDEGTGANTYSFGFAKELRNPTLGNTYSIGNSYDPQGAGFVVPNWTEIINLDIIPRDFVYNLYSQSGQIVQRKVVTVPPLGERDINAGHENGQGAYLSEVQPLDGATKYFANVTRYASNNRAYGGVSNFFFAFPIDSRAGNGDQQLMNTSNQTGQCWSNTNWIEVANVREIPVTATVKFRSASGVLLGQASQVLQPRAQYHFNASSLLPKGEVGSVELTSSDRGSLVATSSVYFHDCQVNQVQTAYATLGRLLGQNVQAGTYNNFLEMKNLFKVSCSPGNPSDFRLQLRSSGQTLFDQNIIDCRTASAVQYNLSDASTFGTSQNTYGTVKLRTAQPRRILADVVRLREVSGKADFAMPTQIQ
ncbi:hypothetical protein JNK13_07075, partial [bacterium]|nr:hypothetical protein [bacterium]